jgi:CO/xanthine dehydrogenase Mo-binding subunit
VERRRRVRRRFVFARGAGGMPHAVNADVTEVRAMFIPETDTQVNDLGIKGLGELGNVGTNAAVANAVYNATGVRVRELPIRLEKLLAQLQTV